MRQALDAPDKVVAVLRDHREPATNPSSHKIEATDDTVERISKDPLSRHKEQGSSLTSSTSTSATATETETAAMSKGQSSTYNMTSSHVVMDAKSSFPQSGNHLKSVGIFEVFSDDQHDENSSHDKLTTPKPTSMAPIKMTSLGSTVLSTLPVTKSSKPFSIFQDKENATSTASSVKASSTSFQVFTDAPDVKQQHVHPTVQPVSSLPSHTSLRMRSPVVQAESNTTSDTADDKQIQDLLNELGILDSEDGTINTRLARRDIDSLFTSDSPESSFLNHQAAESSAMLSRYEKSSPQPIPIPSFAGGAYPSKSDMRTSSLGQFGGNDLSIIEEVSTLRS